MAVTIEDVRYVAGLARLTFSDDEMATLTGQMNAILGHMDALNAVDTTGVEPLAQVVPQAEGLRDDVRRPSLPRAVALQNAPQTDGVYFEVPKVISAPTGAGPDAADLANLSGAEIVE